MLLYIIFFMEGEDQPHKFLFLHRVTKFAALRMLRSSRAYVFYTRHVLESVTKFAKKHVCRSLFLINLSLQLYSKKDSDTGVFL